MNKDVVIVHYNTPELIDAAISSLNKFAQDCHVFVFDNSDVSPFVNRFDNVDVIDNTKGQLIDFNAFLNGYPDKYPALANNWGSAKHIKTIDYCFDLFPEGFVLADSDVLFVNDISGFFDDRFVWVGCQKMHKDRWRINLPRVLPFLCYINVPLCREYNVRYFHPQKTFALTQNIPDIAYDTGCWFYEDCLNKNLPTRSVELSEYILHFGHGSWREKDYKAWLEEYSHLWK